MSRKGSSNPGRNSTQRLLSAQYGAAQDEEVLVAQVQEVLDAHLAQLTQDVPLELEPSQEAKANAFKQEVAIPDYNAGPVALLQFFMRLYWNCKIWGGQAIAEVDWSLVTAQQIVDIYNEVWFKSGTDACPKYMKEDRGRLLKLCQLLVPEKVMELIHPTPSEYAIISFFMACMRIISPKGRRPKRLTEAEKEQIRTKTTRSAEVVLHNMDKLPANVKKYYNVVDGQISCQQPFLSFEGLTDDVKFAAFMKLISRSNKNTSLIEENTADDTKSASDTAAKGVTGTPKAVNNKPRGTRKYKAKPVAEKQEVAQTAHNTNVQSSEGQYDMPHTSSNTLAHQYFPEYYVPQQNNTNMQDNVHGDMKHEHYIGENNTNEWHSSRAQNRPNQWHHNTDTSLAPVEIRTQNNTNERSTPATIKPSSRKRPYAEIKSDDDSEVSCKKSRLMAPSMTPQQGNAIVSLPRASVHQGGSPNDDALLIWLQELANMAIDNPEHFNRSIAPRLMDIIHLAEARAFQTPLNQFGQQKAPVTLHYAPQPNSEQHYDNYYSGQAGYMSDSAEADAFVQQFLVSSTVLSTVVKEKSHEEDDHVMEERFVEDRALIPNNVPASLEVIDDQICNSPNRAEMLDTLQDVSGAIASPHGGTHQQPGQDLDQHTHHHHHNNNNCTESPPSSPLSPVLGPGDFPVGADNVFAALPDSEQLVWDYTGLMLACRNSHSN